LALNTVGSLVKGLMPLRALVAGFFDDDEFCKAWNEEGAVLLQLLVTNGRKRLHDAFNIALLQL